MIQKKLNGDTNESIAEWLRTQYSVEISTRQLWVIFKRCIPELLLKMEAKPMFLEQNQIKEVIKHIESLEDLAKIQFDRIKSQWFDELDQMGNPRMNPQTGEIEYSGTNKNFNETARVYNQLVKNIIELKMSIGLVKKEPESIEITTKTVMDKGTRSVLKGMIEHALTTGPDVTKFIQSIPTVDVTPDEYEVKEDLVQEEQTDLPADDND